jgi:hypothetical protein
MVVVGNHRRRGCHVHNCYLHLVLPSAVEEVSGMGWEALWFRKRHWNDTGFRIVGSEDPDALAGAHRVIVQLNKAR